MGHSTCMQASVSRVATPTPIIDAVEFLSQILELQARTLYLDARARHATRRVCRVQLFSPKGPLLEPRAAE